MQQLSKKNDDFFEKKNPWSEVKDELFACYFKPYIQKILHTRRPILYVDCFAGKGKFTDGKKGSPLIALDIINDCLQSTKIDKTNIQTYFIELNHSEDLRNNLLQYRNANIISGQYETNINQILRNKTGHNVFLYIDPYGIKALQSSYFDSFAKSGFYSIELLINMNSFGFIREACRALGESYDVDVFDDLVEYETTTMDTSQKSINDLNDIAGGNYWREIIDGYLTKKYDGYQAEKMFALQYCRRLQQSYKYVLNMPMKIRRGQQPKYRMIHATNHEAGCLLMVDNMWSRWQALQEIQIGGQQMLWQENTENLSIDEDTVERLFSSYILKYKKFESISMVLASFYVEHVDNGILCPTGTVNKIILSLENKHLIEIHREPPETLNGHKSRFITEDQNKKQHVLIRSSL